MKKITILSLCVILSMSMTLSFATNQSIGSNSSDTFYFQNERAEKNYVKSIHLKSRAQKLTDDFIVRSTPERAEFYKFEADRAYETSHEFYLGRCSVRNGLDKPVTLQYTQQSTCTVSATLGSEAKLHAAVKAGVLEAGTEISSSATLTTTVSRGYVATVGGECESGETITIKAYLGGIAVDGSAVYKVYDRYSNEFLGYEYHPVGDIVVDAGAIDFDVF